MKYILTFFLAAIILLNACKNVQKKQTENLRDSTHMKMDNKQSQKDFAVIENIPAGIDTVFGKAPSKEKGFYKFAFPRTDLKITIDGFSIDTRLAFTTWFSFMPMNNDPQNTMMMGDMVLLETELPQVEKKLQEKGIDITAIHNHLLNEKPKIMYMHIEATGKPVELASKLKDALLLTKTPLNSSYNDQSAPAEWNEVEQIFGIKGKTNGSVINFGIPRKEVIMEGDMQLPPGFGISTSISFQKSGSDAGITGDFVLLAGEVNPVIKALTDNGIIVTAVHNHMLNDNPRLFMMHFWAVGKPGILAKGLKSALDLIGSKAK